MTGCQTKLVLGHNCGAGELDVKITPKEMEKAKKRITDDFIFIGLTEYPIGNVLKLCFLFHFSSIPC